MIRTNLKANNKFFFILVALFTVLMSSAPVYGIWKSGGPYGGYVNCLGMAQANPDIIYAGTEAGVFKTINAGASWSKTGFIDIRVLEVQVAPDDPNTVYAGTEDGLYKSENGGSSWTQLGLATATINSIAIDPSNPNIVYVGTGIESSSPGDILGLYKSIDGGGTWNEKLGEEIAVFSVFIHTNNPSIIFAGLSGLDSSTNFRKSEDGGDSWASSSIDNISNTSVVEFAMTPSGHNPEAIYAILAGFDVYKSIDCGDTWDSTGTPGVSLVSPWGLEVDPNDPNIIYVGHSWWDKHFYKSSDGGVHWSIKVDGLPKGRPSDIGIDPRTGNLYVSLLQGGIYQSTDAADSWNIQALAGTHVEGLAVNPTDSKMVLAAIEGSGHYLAKTTNKGNFWNYVIDLPTDQGAVAFDPNNPSVIYVGEGWHSGNFLNVHKTSNGGQNWEKIRVIYVVPPGSASFGVSEIWIDPENSNNVLVAVAGNFGGGVYKSTNGGYAWRRTYNMWASALSADPYDSNIIFVGTARKGYVFMSDDGGDSWVIVSPGGDWVWEVRDLETDLNSHLYAATDEGLLKWDNSSWSKITGLPSDNITALAIWYNTDSPIICAGTFEEGVFVSKNKGNTWDPFNERLINLSITKLTVSITQPKIIYAGTAYGGVWGRALRNLAGPWVPLLLFGD